VLLERLPTREDVLQLFDLLRREDASRGAPMPLSFGCGCWIQNDRFGLMRNYQLFPLTVQFMNSFVRPIRRCPRYPSIVLFCDVQAETSLCFGLEVASLRRLTTFSGRMHLQPRSLFL
ncbi:unnamed protein product, partial [Symbiodinium sp. CCMP2456]